jgi:hypothetical protein
MEKRSQSLHPEQKIKIDLKDRSLSQINASIEGLFSLAREKLPDASFITLTQEVTGQIPQKIPDSINKQALQAAASQDEAIASEGKKTLIYLNLKTLLATISGVTKLKEDENEDEVFQRIVVEILPKLAGLDQEVGIAQQINRMANIVIRKYVQEREQAAQEAPIQTVAEIEDPHTEPHIRAEERELASVMKDVVNDIPGSAREVIILGFGLNNQPKKKPSEIGKLLHLPTSKSTIWSRQKKILKKTKGKRR